jgi:photosystem II stability/assembly factor-like uncharacterized protein
MLALSAVGAAPAPPSAQATRPLSFPPEMLEDAELTAICFVDADQGWAVGDKGIIVHSEDGGRNWKVQPAPVSCRLHSVQFLDPQIGWAVGGRVHPYTHRTSGVVLRTNDGGTTWKQVPDLTLPALKVVRFVNPRQGWAVGNPCALYPTGVFRSEDGGQSWTTVPGAVRGGWTAGDFRNSMRGVVVGYDGRLARISVPEFELIEMADVGARPLRAVRFSTDAVGWLAGDGGLLLNTVNAGNAWQTPPQPIPPEVAAQFDFRALDVLGDNIWVAGAPGSCVLHSGDAGKTWNVYRTDQSLPLNALRFLDEQRGWAVGAMGTILLTRDGGKTWRCTRRGGSRAALLGLFSDSDAAPWELFAWESGHEGYLGVAEFLMRESEESPRANESPLDDRLAEAMSAVGGSSTSQAWQFPMPPTELKLSAQSLTDGWDRLHGGQAYSRLEELLVRRIRQWRPEVIVTEAASPRGERPLSHIMNQLVLTAARNAADASMYPEHMTLAGLQPWSVKKVFSVEATTKQATVTLNTAQVSPRWGCALSEKASEAYSLVRSRYQPVPTSLGLRLMVDELPQEVGRRDIFSGIFLSAGGEARRIGGTFAVADVEGLKRAAQARRNLEQIFLQSTTNSTASAGWLAQVREMTVSMNGPAAGQLLYQLGQRYLASGEWEMAAQSYTQLVERFPDHPLSDAALIWLVQYYTSGEAGWQIQKQTQVAARSGQVQITQVGPAGGVQTAGLNQAVDQPPFGGVVQAAFAADDQTGHAPVNPAAPPRSQSGMADRAIKALNFAKLIQRGRPGVLAEPSVQFPLSVAFRLRGEQWEAEKYFHRMSSNPLDADWASSAQAELWIAKGRGRAPKPVYACRNTQVKPYLDGRLDDEAWQEAEQMELTGSQPEQGAWPAAAMLAYDSEYLYLAVQCRKAPGTDYPTTTEVRTRDTDLALRDRVAVCLDIDRDYSSFYQLSVDHRGWTGEACLNSPQWNPTWYVANLDSGEDWTMEAAIPWSELASAAPQPNEVWGLGVQRIIPGLGIQAYTQPATVEPRGERFALLRFE